VLNFKIQGASPPFRQPWIDYDSSGFKMYSESYA